MYFNQGIIAQQKAALEAALRSGKSGIRLLDDSDQNVGNGQALNPQIVSARSFVITPNQESPRILNLTAMSKTGQTITCIVTASRITGQNGQAGPVTAIFEFGNGSQTTKFEADVPLGPYVDKFYPGGAIDGSIQPHDSGVIVQIPAGVLRVFLRYDNAFITPTIQGYAFGTNLGNILNPLSGPFGTNTINPSSVLVKAFADYYGRHWSATYKTQYLYYGSLTDPVLFTNQIVLLPAIIPVIYAIPPFAKNVRLLREPQTAAMTVTLTDEIGGGPPGAPRIFEQYDIASGLSPVMPITGNTHIISVASATANDVVSAVKLVYEIGF